VVRPVNDAPVANDDERSLFRNGTIDIDVLANDRDLNKDTLALTAMTQPAHGTAVIENGVIRYTPAANYHGADVFQYTVRNDKGHTATASASVAVFAVNDTPTVAFIADRLVLEGESLSFSVDATDVDGDSLSYQLLGSGATLDSSGRFHLTALDGDASLSFTIQVSDGASVAERDFTLTLANVAPTLTVAGAESVAGGQPYTIQLAASDPGDDAIQFWRVSWGDGESEILPADARQASHLYSRAGGRFTVEAYAEDEDGGDGMVIDVKIDPLDPVILVSNGVIPPATVFTATGITDKGKEVPLTGSWKYDRPDLASIGGGTGDLTATGLLGGVGKVTFASNGLSAETTATVKLYYSSDPGVDPGIKDAFDGAVDPDPALTLLYPYDKTVFPRGLTGPRIQWNGGNANDWYYVHAVAEAFEFEGWSQVPPPSRYDFPVMPTDVWLKLTASTDGDVTFDIQRHDGNKAYLAKTQTWTIAPADLTGTVYYWEEKYPTTIQRI